MKSLSTIISLSFALVPLAYGYEGPSPLVDVGVGVSVTRSSNGLFSYGYTIQNPSRNDGQIASIHIFIPTDPSLDAPLSPDGLTHCKRFHAVISQQIQQKLPMVPVGSSGPDKWSCGYAGLAGYSVGSYGWGAIDDPYLISPGKSMSGFALNSPGLPGIRDIVIEPDINTDLLPPSYRENLSATIALKNKVKWTGQTVGPKAPPLAFDANAFITYLISLKSQSETLGWIGGKGFGKSIEEKLDHAKTEIAACRINAAKGTLNAFENEVRATWEEEQREERRGHGEKDSDKRITSQGYALLFFNGKYLLTQIEKRTNLNCPVERNGDHDHDGDDGKKDR